VTIWLLLLISGTAAGVSCKLDMLNALHAGSAHQPQLAPQLQSSPHLQSEESQVLQHSLLHSQSVAHHRTRCKGWRAHRSSSRSSNKELAPNPTSHPTQPVDQTHDHSQAGSDQPRSASLNCRKRMLNRCRQVDHCCTRAVTCWAVAARAAVALATFARHI
jgi:hypothetical protein